MAALHYRRLRTQFGQDLRLLFVAHRKEILEQSLATFGHVLHDATFGELYFGGTRPQRWRHVFASIQSLTSYGVDQIPPTHFDVVIIDEFQNAPGGDLPAAAHPPGADRAARAHRHP